MKKALYICAGVCGLFFVLVGFFGYTVLYRQGGVQSVVNTKAKAENVMDKEHGVSVQSARILFVGDMMFDRTIRAKAEVKGYDHLFSCVHDYMAGFDWVIGNIEGSITKYNSLSVGTNPGEMNNTSFTFAPAVARALFDNNVRMVNVGNNHSLDFGQAGAESTRKYLDEAQVQFFGSPKGSIVATTTVQGFRLAFVNFNQFLGLNDPQKTIRAIAEVRLNTDYIFVYTHWGEEYAPATEHEKALARDFIDAGADMIIGSHPHVIQEHALYKGKHIFYSLGNFIFDQYFSDEVKTGGGVEVIITPRGLEVKEKTFNLFRDGTTCLG